MSFPKPGSSRQQQLAKRALHAARQCEADSDLTTMAKQLPTMLRVNGLLSTWAFLLSKEKKSKAASTCLQVLGRNALSSQELNQESANEQAFRKTLNSSPSELQHFTDRALEFSLWWKIAIESICGESE